MRVSIHSTTARTATGATSTLEHADGQNHALVKALIELLVRAVDPKHADLPQIRESLRSTHAKIWIDESEVDRRPGLDIKVGVPEWELAAKDAFARLNAGEQGIPNKVVDRIFGVRAPEGSLLKVMGAWIAPDGSVHTVPSKLRRGNDIKNFGIS